MRIALAVTEFPSASQTFVLDHLRGLLAHGHRVEVQALRAGRHEALHAELRDENLLALVHAVTAPPGSPRRRLLDALRRLPVPLLQRPALAWRLARAAPAAERLYRLYQALPLWQSGPVLDLIHAHSGQNGLRLLPLYAAGHLRAPLVVTFHGQDVHGFLHGRRDAPYRPLFAQAAALVVCSGFMAERLRALGAPEHKLRLIPNGIEPERQPWRERQHPGPLRPVQLLSIGRLVPFKGLDRLLAALADPALASRDWQLHLVGDGPQRAALQAQATALGLTGRVCFHGAQPREAVRALIERCDLYLGPAVIDAEGNTETQGVALLEAMASGLPVIASAVGGIPETLGEAAAALPPPGDPAALAHAIADLLDAPASWPQYSRAGRARVEHHYRNRDWIDRLLALYESLIPTRRR